HRDGAFQVVAQGVDHDVADELDACRIDAFAHQVVAALALGEEQQVGHLVGQDAVDLFRHVAVIAAQAGFDVDHRDAFLYRHQGAGQGRVDVAYHQHRGRADLVDGGFEQPHDLGGLDGVGAGADFEVDVRVGQA